ELPSVRIFRACCMNSPSATTSRPPARREDAVGIIRRLREAGYTAYLAGGCVRDELLGLIPKDYDVATDAPPDRVRQLFPRSQAVGAAFGVILVHSGQSMIEVATFRAESGYSDGRHPDTVVFTDAAHDARRRDFTINGLFLDPIENRLIDFVGGQDDLNARRLRAIGNPHDRFAEDYLRMLRAVRFAARFNLTIEPTTGQAILRHAPLLSSISPERVCEELRLMLTPPTRIAAWQMLREFQLLQVITRFARRDSPPHDPPAAGDGAVFPHVAPEISISFPLALAAVACDVLRAEAGAVPLNQVFSRPALGHCVRGLRKALRLSNDETEALRGILDVAPLLDPAGEPRTALLKRFLARPTAADARRLLEALGRVDPADQRIPWLQRMLTALQLEDVAPPPLITGDDLIALGLSPGPQFRHLLEAVYDEQLEGRLADKGAALEFARRLASAR
ncbi:MAG: CCA tRNA nucleotidyltransferase, partial [Phycisphaerae bacterium]|nr:CCA tRNA nucleotidyltransferase [Phycisphaerae bacterium]MDW8263527.1 CCA tRNA nucleotidyltransferase [Phycisphaerales bacterium]